MAKRWFERIFSRDLEDTAAIILGAGLFAQAALSIFLFALYRSGDYWALGFLVAQFALFAAVSMLVASSFVLVRFADDVVDYLLDMDVVPDRPEPVATGEPSEPREGPYLSVPTEVTDAIRQGS